MIRELFLFQMKKHGRLSIILGFVIALLSLGSMLVFKEETVMALSEARAQAPALFSALRFGSSVTLLDHVASLLYGFVLPIIGSSFSIHLAARLFPSQLETGELSFYLSLPIKRVRYALAQGAVLLSCLILMQLIAILGTFLSALLVKQGTFNIAWFLALNAGQLCLWILSAGIAFLLASMVDDQHDARRKSNLIIGVFFLISMIAQVKTLPGFIKWLSPYSLFDPQGLVKGKIGMEILAMPAIGIACMLIGARHFSVRDLPL